MSMELVRDSPAVGELVFNAEKGPPAIVARAGGAAVFVWEEFVSAEIRNWHTVRPLGTRCGGFWNGAMCAAWSWPGSRRGWWEVHGRVARSPPTKKQHLAAIRGLFDKLVLRHVVPLNPAACVSGERYQVIEGKTPEITPAQARVLLISINAAHVVGLRDRAIIGVIYTAARVGAVAKLQVKHLEHDGAQYCLRFDEKGGKSRLIPCGHDREGFRFRYVIAVVLREAKEGPLFRSTVRKTKQLTANAMTAIDMGRMVKRRMKDTKLPDHLSPHSFHVATLTNLLEQGVAQEDVQYLAGHADARTTRLYDRRQKKVTRNIVERISI
jgi:integrase/recombinase XerD